MLEDLDARQRFVTKKIDWDNTCDRMFLCTDSVHTLPTPPDLLLTYGTQYCWYILHFVMPVSARGGWVGCWNLLVEMPPLAKGGLVGCGSAAIDRCLLEPLAGEGRQYGS